jgi:hypothetical protein
VACKRCNRAGKYKLAKLIEQHGRSFPIPLLLDELAGDCPKRESVTVYDLCGIFCPGLAELSLSATRAAVTGDEAQMSGSNRRTLSR